MNQVSYAGACSLRCSFVRSELTMKVKRGVN